MSVLLLRRVGSRLRDKADPVRPLSAHSFVMKTPYACPVSGGGFFGAIWSIIVS